MTIYLKDNLFEMGGSIGTNYDNVTNKPQINNHVLNPGNNTADSLGLQDKLIFDNTLSGKGTAEDPLRVTFESFKWNVVSEGEQDLSSNNGYITNGTDSSSFTLPVISEVGDTISISAHTSYGWRLNQRADQQIFYGDIACTLGVDGFVQSTSMGDSIHMICVVANTTWRVVNSQGNIQYA